jgi:hypothetical protein
MPIYTVKCWLKLLKRSPQHKRLNRSQRCIRLVGFIHLALAGFIGLDFGFYFLPALEALGRPTLLSLIVFVKYENIVR